MQTNSEVAMAFLTELQDLLDRYEAEIEVKEHYMGYPECGSDLRMEVYIPPIWNKDGTFDREQTEIDLGIWMGCRRKEKDEA